ncbi:hypothetical protein Nepgr_008876 [Nepenthes gracilis]|uniref:CTLH domain-containing protein n=1 Tax=Nepenthes gracilis TaxID=150966 RepID=A0AAD3XJW2_NEPGR|nr:hypothetical protein Nepgr_008876 [Nepenthes gracilis]
MSAIQREIAFIILQFLNDENFKEAAHKLEQESGYFFNLRYFGDLVLGGNWDEVDRYLSGFTKSNDNGHSMKLFFELCKIKYLEALDRRDWSKAVEILSKELKVFEETNKDVYDQLAQLITVPNFKENASFAGYGDTRSNRQKFLADSRKYIEANPLFREKLQFPNIKPTRLTDLITQSLNWQYSVYWNHKSRPVHTALCADHNCNNDAFAQAMQNYMLFGAPQNNAFRAVGHNTIDGNSIPPFIQHNPHPPAMPLWSPRAPSASHPLLSMGTGNHRAMPHQAPQMTVDFGANSNFRPQGTSKEVLLLPTCLPGASQNPAIQLTDQLSTTVGLPLNQGPSGMCVDHRSRSTFDLPLVVGRTLNHRSLVMSMDFHPIHQTLLLFGSNNGDIGLWEVRSKEELYSQIFMVWDLSKCSLELKTALSRDPTNPINRVTWSFDGSLFGIAYSKHIVQTYVYRGGSNIEKHFEIEAHHGGVNGLAFCIPRGKLSLVTCGDDKAIRVWDASNGVKLIDLVGHEAPVYSVFPHYRNNTHFILSASTDGKIKVWLYDGVGARMEYTAHSNGFFTMAYSDDGRRLFACGMSTEGEPYIVEWNEDHQGPRKSYLGLKKRTLSMLHFDVSRNRYLAAGDDHRIKYWDIDHENVLATVDADGGLPETPCIRFNKGGSLLAVSAEDKGVKILANIHGCRLLCKEDAQIPDTTLIVPEVGMQNAEARAGVIQFAPRSAARIIEIEKPDQLQSLQLPAPVKADTISRLMYTNSGTAILALLVYGVNLLWRWPLTEDKKPVSATTMIQPVLWHPSSGILMTNDMTGAKSEEALPCSALSNNDAYLISASGGKASLFRMSTAELLITFADPPPAVTYLAFLPGDNNVIAIGLDDSSILIYNIRFDKIEIKLEGHSQRITCLAFSSVLHVLISAGADAQIILWSYKKRIWERVHSQHLWPQVGNISAGSTNIKVEFHRDQHTFLVVQEKQLGIFAADLTCIRQCGVRGPSDLISGATFSCDGQLVYTSFVDGTVCVHTASDFTLQCRIKPTAYLPPVDSAPVAIAAHPSVPNQFALGLSSGEIYVLEPLDTVGRMGCTSSGPECLSLQCPSS